MRGIEVDGTNLARVVMKDAYVLFPGTDAKDLNRKAFLADLTIRLYRKLLAGTDTQALATALGEASRGRHLMVWSSRARDMSALGRLQIDGGLPDPDLPFAAIYSQNASANKMDYYMRRTISVTAHPEPKGPARFEMDVTLSNTGPGSGLPDYVLGVDDTVPDFAPGLVRSYVSIYLSPRAQVASFAVDGVPAPYEAERSPSAIIASRFVAVPPHAKVHLRIAWSLRDAVDATGRFRFKVLSQPMTEPDDVTARIVGSNVATSSTKSSAELLVDAMVRRTIARRLVDALSVA